MLPRGTGRGMEEMHVRQGGVARPTKATAGSKRMKDMSLRRKQILQFIENFLARRAYPPTIREIQGHLKPAASGKPVSTSVVDYNLNILEERNLIRRNRHISRGIELVNPPHGAARGTVAIPLVGDRKSVV